MAYRVALFASELGVSKTGLFGPKTGLFGPVHFCVALSLGPLLKHVSELSPFEDGYANTKTPRSFVVRWGGGRYQITAGVRGESRNVKTEGSVTQQYSASSHHFSF